MMLKPDDI